MFRYEHLLLSIYRQAGHVVLIEPPRLVAHLPGMPVIAQKYLAYIDKLLLFPLWLAICTSRYDKVHIADHGNAYYSFCCSRNKCIVTCHDMLAVRAAFGDSTTHCKPSPIGIWLQRLILAGLKRAGAVVFVSKATMKDYQRLIGIPDGQRQVVIPNALNAPFCHDPEAFPLTPADASQVPKIPYLMMVGSALPRKNRSLAIKLLEFLGTTSPYSVVFAGASLTEAEQSFRSNHPFGDRIISIERPSHALLNRLYCEAHALLFPSFSEGFGWPLVEAQTCHCPVIASPTTSIPEVAGEGALYAEPTDVAGFASHVRTLEHPAVRACLIERGIANTRRYTAEVVGEAYRRFAFEA